MYYNSDNKETGSVNIIELTSFVNDDFLKIIDFLYVSGTIDIKGSDFNEESIKKFILRLSLEEETILRESYYEKKRKTRCEGDAYEKEVFKIENSGFIERNFFI
jgi:hypothetical protein